MTQDGLNEKMVQCLEILQENSESLRNRVDSLETSIAWAGLAIFLLSVALSLTAALCA